MQVTRVWGGTAAELELLGGPECLNPGPKWQCVTTTKSAPGAGTNWHPCWSLSGAATGQREVVTALFFCSQTLSFQIALTSQPMHSPTPFNLLLLSSCWAMSLPWAARELTKYLRHRLFPDIHSIYLQISLFFSTNLSLNASAVHNKKQYIIKTQNCCIIVQR